MTLLAISAIGADRPGIVAALTQVLYDRGCNLEDTSMTILRGHFAMTLIVAGDGSGLEAALQEALPDLLLTVREVPAEHEHRTARPYVVSVYGADHPGILTRIAAVLAERAVNITDLTTRLVDDLYAMVLDVDLPASADEADVERALHAAAADLDVEATIRPAEPDIL